MNATKDLIDEIDKRFSDSELPNDHIVMRMRAMLQYQDSEITRLNDAIERMKKKVESMTLIDECLQLSVKYDLGCDIYMPHLDDDNHIVLDIIANGLFYWATSEGEQITADNFHVFEESIKDCKALNHEHWGPLLFVCRIRKLRPQGARYEHMPKELKPLFNACGPHRPTDNGGFGNPHDQNEYESEVDDAS